VISRSIAPENTIYPTTHHWLYMAVCPERISFLMSSFQSIGSPFMGPTPARVQGPALPELPEDMRFKVTGEVDPWSENYVL